MQKKVWFRCCFKPSHQKKPQGRK